MSDHTWKPVRLTDYVASLSSERRAAIEAEAKRLVREELGDVTPEEALQSDWDIIMDDWRTLGFPMKEYTE